MKENAAPLMFGHLVDYPHAIPTIAQWKFDEYGHLFPGYSVKAAAARLASWTNRKEIPIAIIACRASQIYGMYSLISNDMDMRPHLTPWLASVFVNPELRGQGVGTLLVLDAAKRARDLKVRNLYLYTKDKANWYAAMGWRAMEDTVYHGQAVTVMECIL